MKYNKTLQIFATPSDESQSNLAVTAVAEYVFCSRKAALVAHHVPGDESSPNFALGTTEHELRKKLAERLRDRYRDLTSVQSVDQFLHQDLLDVIIAASTWVKNTARMTHPLYFDQIEMTLRNHTEEILLREEEGRLVR
ncbi:MAG TPA: hypothetical protein VHO25_21560, partial [Polyangiaceae bacterium]|nr:hypothetical protein [Polyangiaceae bacterium]